ncbi:MAG: hypothetical protein WCY93_04205, partial [Anaerolineaceae bacterium]
TLLVAPAGGPLGGARWARITPAPAGGKRVWGPGGGGRLKVVGGRLGVVIDARGRPLQLPKQPELRIEFLNHWQRMLRADHG